VARSVDEIEHVILAVAGAIFEANRLRLNRDAALALDIHGIEHLLDHFTGLQPAGELDQPVGQRRFAMIDMGDNRKVADVLDGNRGHGAQITFAPRSGKRRAASRGVRETPANPTHVAPNERPRYGPAGAAELAAPSVR